MRSFAISATTAAMLPPTLSPATTRRLASTPNSSACSATYWRRHTLLDRDREAALGRALIVDEHDHGVGADGELADQPVVRFLVADHPAAAMDVDHGGQLSRRLFRAQDPYPRGAGRTNAEDAVFA